MNTEYFSISTDTSFFNGVSQASLLPLNTPENVRDVPCDGCSNAEKCAATFGECVAFRVWSSDGDYQDRDVGRLIRVPRELRR